MKMFLIEDLQNGMELAQDVFASPDSVAPISRSGIILSEYVIARMRNQGIRSVYIKSENNNSNFGLADSIRGKPSPIINKELRNDALNSLEDIFNAASISEQNLQTSAAPVIGKIDSVVDKLVDSLSTERDALVNISDLKSYDDYTYHHSLSVSILSLSMALYMGYNSKELNRLGVCAMMHDIGKTAIPLEIIRKPSKLSDEEFELIKTHSSAGHKYLTSASIGDEDLWRGVLHHHEKIDGTGYPNGLKNYEIPEWSRIISVADVYDALTSNRPYRKPMQPSDAVEYIMGGSGSAFDFDIVSALVKKVDLYPIGCEVALSDRRIAEVLNNENQMRPIIRISETGEIMDLYRDRQCLSLVITKVVSPAPAY